MTRLPFFVQMGALDPSMSATPQAFADAMVQRMRIVGPSGYYGIVVQDTEPTSNQGLWLAPGTNGSRQPWVFDPDISRYVPLDVSASITSVLEAIAALQAKFAKGRIIFSAFDTPPGETDRANVLWVPTLNDVAHGIYAWNGTKWARVAGAGASTITTSGTATAFTGDAGDPDVLVESDLYGRLFIFTTHTTNGEAATFQYGTFPARPFARPDGSAVLAGEIPSGTVFVARLDAGAKWKILTPLTPLVTPALTKRFVSEELDIETKDHEHKLGGTPLIMSAVLVCKVDNNGFVKDREVQASRFIADVAEGTSEEVPLIGLSATNLAVRSVITESYFQVIFINDLGVRVQVPSFDFSQWKLKIVAFL